MRVINYSPDQNIKLPVSGAGSAIVKGTLLARGALTSAATKNGHLEPTVSNSVSAIHAVGILQEAHATALDTDVAGTIFTVRPVDLVMPYRVVRMEYSLASGDLITCTQAVSTTTMTVTSLEDDIDAGFVYVVSGTGAGQMNYLTAAAAGACTLKAAFGTNLDATSKFIKILPRFHITISYTSDGTKLSSQAAVGIKRGFILDIHIVRNNNEQQLDPTKHSALTNLNSLASLRFEADVAITDTGPYPLA